MSGTEIAIAIVAVLAGALVKSVTGMGFPIIAIPVMSLFVSVTDAVVVIALPNALMNLTLLLRVRDQASATRDLPVLGAAGVVGAVVGTFVLVSVPEEPLLIALAVVVLVYIANTLRRPDASVSPATATRWAPGVGLAAGLMQGAVGISGPVVASWIHAYRLSRDAFVFSVTLLFLLSGSAQLVTLLIGGEFTRSRVGVTLAAVPLVLAVIPLGARLRDRLPLERFNQVVLSVLAISAIALVVRVLA